MSVGRRPFACFFTYIDGHRVAVTRFKSASASDSASLHIVFKSASAPDSGSGSIISMAIHPQGDNIIVGTTASRVEWFDLDLSGKAYKVIRNHTNTVQDVDFHARYPLFASASDDGQVHVFHGMVYNDFETNPLIVPVKILKNAHAITGHLGAQSCCFHPQSAGASRHGASDSRRSGASCCLRPCADTHYACGQGASLGNEVCVLFNGASC